MLIYAIVGAYFYLRAGLAFMGKTYLYTERSLKAINPEDLSGYLKEVGVCQFLSGTVFLAYAIVRALVGSNLALHILFGLFLLGCVVLFSKCESKYNKQE